MATLFKLFSTNSVKFRYLQVAKRFTASKVTTKETDEEDELTDKPIQYSTSNAATWKAEHSFRGTSTEDVRPHYQPYVVCLSLAAFLVYFGILREESDWDHGIYEPMQFENQDSFRETQLIAAIDYYKSTNPTFDRSKLEKRLEEIRAEKSS